MLDEVVDILLIETDTISLLDIPSTIVSEDADDVETIKWVKWLSFEYQGQSEMHNRHRMLYFMSSRREPPVTYCVTCEDECQFMFCANMLAGELLSFSYLVNIFIFSPTERETFAMLSFARTEWEMISL